MTSSSARPRSPASRKIIALGIAVVVAIAAYSGAWYYAAGKLKEHVMTAIGDQRPGAPQLTCETPDIHGYPFRIGLWCSTLKLDDVSKGLAATFGPFRSAAQVYAPGHIVSELDGPATIRSAGTIAGTGINGTAQWAALRASTIFSDNALDRLSVETNGLQTSLTETVEGKTIDLAAGHGEVHLRRNGADLEGAATFRDTAATLRALNIALPKATMDIDFLVEGQAEILDFNGDLRQRLYGSTGQIRKLSADIGEGRALGISGPYQIDQEGLISGDFDVSIAGMPGWTALIVQNFPQATAMVTGAGSILKSLSGGAETITARITVRKGAAMLSFIPLGRIPPL